VSSPSSPSFKPCLALGDWDQYYASLEHSSQATPSGLSAPGSSDFGDFPADDDEDIKPSVEYLDSLNEYRKRSRSHENAGADAANKLPKIEDGFGGATGYLNGGTSAAPTPAVEDVPMAEEEVAVPAEDPIVYGTSPCVLSPLCTRLTHPTSQ
jgi:transcription initiation factor TFIIE subunit alpha